MTEFENDRDRWNSRHKTRPTFDPSAPLIEWLSRVPVGTGWALDVAGGDGRHGAWLADRGWKVVVADISHVGLARARQRCSSLRLVETELGGEEGRSPLPFVEQAFDLIVVHHFLSRPLLRRVNEFLSEGGSFVMIHPTRRNLERHPRPPERYLLDEGELETLVSGLELRHFSEGWNSEERHEAVLWGVRDS